MLKITPPSCFLHESPAACKSDAQAKRALDPSHPSTVRGFKRINWWVIIHQKPKARSYFMLGNIVWWWNPCNYTCLGCSNTSMGDELLTLLFSYHQIKTSPTCVPYILLKLSLSLSTKHIINPILPRASSRRNNCLLFNGSPCPVSSKTTMTDLTTNDPFFCEVTKMPSNLKNDCNCQRHTPQ